MHLCHARVCPNLLQVPSSVGDPAAQLHVMPTAAVAVPALLHRSHDLSHRTSEPKRSERDLGWGQFFSCFFHGIKLFQSIYLLQQSA